MPDSKQTPSNDLLRRAILGTQGEVQVSRTEPAFDETSKKFGEWFQAQRRRTFQSRNDERRETDGQDS